ncbi:hypothetical protein [Pseudomonas brassicacearum]|uniref:Uncharacterized protein n=1 Tax=Pseudomonas brassicacearum TaxID=930166 RepID=A0A423GML7_9PSED|nr:hypothetical protein [Pseudomonas brassicacearum]ROM93278.1 hypothetical protein BK658_19800 [Pseudomonas brassicacearum]
MNIWSDFVLALGQKEAGDVVENVFRRIGESPSVSETPDSYNDPLGKTKFYKFYESGLEFGFRSGKLNHVHFFVQDHEGYSAYRGDMLGRVAQVWNCKEVVRELGIASRAGEGRVDMLIGYVHQWMRYEYGEYALRMEFSQNGDLWKATLIST